MTEIAKYHLHVGVKTVDMITFRRHVTGLSLPFPIIDGDGWQCWGEAVGTVDNPDVLTLHHIIPLDVPVGQALELSARLVEAAAAVLEPLPPLDKFAYAAVLTSGADWGEEEHEIPFPEED